MVRQEALAAQWTNGQQEARAEVPGPAGRPGSFGQSDRGQNQQGEILKFLVKSN